MGDEHVDFGFQLAFLDAEVGAHDLLLEFEFLYLVGKSLKVEFNRIHLELADKGLPACEAESLPLRGLSRDLFLEESNKEPGAAVLLLEFALPDDVTDPGIVRLPTFLGFCVCGVRIFGP